MKVFLSGIAGVGMSSIAGLFYQNGYEIYGSDTNFYPPVDKILKDMKAKIFDSYDEKNIPDDIDFCVIGNIVSRGNPEAEYILNNDIKYYSMAEALYKFFIRGKKSVVVAGTHGKTTISSFISYLFDYAGLKPGFFIGGKPLNFESNYSVGSGNYFVVEGDEYETSFFDRSSKFLKYHPLYLILTSLEYDHIDFFPDKDSYIKSFKNLVNQVPSNGIIVMNGDFEMNRKVVEKSFTRVITYGLKNTDYLIKNIELKNNQYQFVLRNQSNEIKFKTPLLGRYNIWNLSSGIILGLYLGIHEKVIREAVETFKGVDRRLVIINKLKNTLFLEDFAHHPTSIKSSLESLKELYPGKRIITLFEPRSWSLRRNYFQDRLRDSFLDSDEIIIKDVYHKEKIPINERLDLQKIKYELGKTGKRVLVFCDYEEIKGFLLEIDLEKDNLVVIISNGSFGGLVSFVKELKT